MNEDEIADYIDQWRYLLVESLKAVPADRDYWGLTALSYVVCDRLEGIAVLYKAHSLTNVAVLLRSVFEAIAGLMYMLKANTPQRSRAYLVFRELETHKVICSRLDRSVPQGPPLPEIDTAIAESKRWQKADVALIINKLRADFPTEFREFDDLKRGGNWYSMFGGPRNVRELLDDLGDPLRELYHQYQTGSASVHGTTPVDSKPLLYGSVHFAQHVVRLLHNHMQRQFAFRADSSDLRWPSLATREQFNRIESLFKEELLRQAPWLRKKYQP